MFDEIFKFMSADFSKLAKFGFVKSGDVWKFETKILDGEFLLLVFVDKNGKVGTKVVDTSSGEEYVLHLLQSSQGQFVGQVRSEVEAVLKKIRQQCFSREVFKAQQSKALLAFAKENFGGSLEFLWDSSPNVAVLRRADTKKWYAVMFVLEKSKLFAKAGKMTEGKNKNVSACEKVAPKKSVSKKENERENEIDAENQIDAENENVRKNESGGENESGDLKDKFVEIVDLHIQPQEAEKIVDNKTIFAGYHMNKKSWITICLDGCVETQTILKLLENSFSLAVK